MGDSLERGQSFLDTAANAEVNIDVDEMLKRIDATASDDIKSFVQINGIIGMSNLTKVEIGYLHKLIKKKSGLNLSDLKADLRPERDRLSQEEIAQKVIENIGRDNILHTNGVFYLWDDSGVWKIADDKLVKKEIHQAHRDESIEIVSSQVEAICNLTKTETFKPNHRFNINKLRINCLNGELVSRDGEWHIEGHCREHFNTSQLPVKYNPEARSPLFEKFLGEIFHDAENPEEVENKISLTLELMGYSLMSSSEYEKFIILIGTGANGKSVLLSIIERLVGRDNVAAVQPSQFANRFQRAHLDGKLVNIVTEIAEGAVIADAELKAIVSGELTTAEHKNRDPFDFHPFSTCWFGTNHMPHTRDFSDALQRRAEILEFPHQFKGKDCDPKLKDKLITEIEGILVLALNAIGNVFERGEFTRCAQSDAAKLQWRKEADQVAQFVEECCRDIPAMSNSTANLYAEYQSWVTRSGVKNALGKNKFSHRLERLGYVHTRGTNGTRGFKGITIDRSRAWE